MCVGREGVIRRTREGDRIQEAARAVRVFDAVRFLESGVLADDAPDEEARGGKTGVEITLLAIFQEQVIARIAADERLETLGAAALDGREDERLFFRRIDHRGLQPAELFLAPRGHVLRAALLEFGGHEAPHADALGAGIFRARVEVGQAEHVAEFMAEDADARHRLAALGADEIRDAPVLAGAREVNRDGRAFAERLDDFAERARSRHFDGADF